MFNEKKADEDIEYWKKTKVIEKKKKRVALTQTTSTITSSKLVSLDWRHLS